MPKGVLMQEEASQKEEIGRAFLVLLFIGTKCLRSNWDNYSIEIKELSSVCIGAIQDGT